MAASCVLKLAAENLQNGDEKCKSDDKNNCLTSPRRPRRCSWPQAAKLPTEEGIFTSNGAKQEQNVRRNANRTCNCIGSSYISPEEEVACEGSIGDVVVGGYGLGVIGRMGVSGSSNNNNHLCDGGSIVRLKKNSLAAKSGGSVNGDAVSTLSKQQIIAQVS